MRLIFFFAVCASAQMEQPRIGTMLDSSSLARPVFGVAASATAGGALGRFLSIACSSGACAAKTAHEIVSWSAAGRQSIPAPKGPAIFAFDRDSILVYSNHKLIRWRGGAVEPVPLNITGEVLSMRGPDFAVRRDDGTWIVQDGDIAVAAIPEATGPVMLLDGAVLFAANDETVLRRADGDVRFPVRANAFIAMSDAYVEIRSGSLNYALRIEPRREKLFVLPEAQ